MKKKRFLVLGIGLFSLSLPLITFAEKSTIHESLSEEKVVTTITDDSNKEIFKTKKEFSILSGNDIGTINGNSVKLNGPSLDLNGKENYLRFTQVVLPQDATLTKATLLFTAKNSSKKPTSFTIQGQLGDNSPFRKDKESFANREISQTSITAHTPDTVAINETFETENLLPLINEMKDSTQDDTLIFKLVGEDTGKYIAKSFDTNATPKLVLEYESNYNEISIPITQESDIAKENYKTNKVTTSGNIEFGGHKGNPTTNNKQTIGLRFNEIELPEQAKIDEAYIEFTSSTKSNKDNSANLTIVSEIGDSVTYTRENSQITNRNYGQLMVKTTMDTFKEKNTTIRTDDLKEIINENRLSGWQSGQALSFKIDGDNYLGNIYGGVNLPTAPKLIIKYTLSDNPVEFDDIITENKDIQQVYINEVSREGTNDSKASWIELYNANDKPVLLSQDISLTSKKKNTNLTGIFIPAHGYKIIYMDGKSELGNDHINFELSKSGSLSLIDLSEDKNRTIDTIDYDKHAYNQTIGRQPDGSSTVYLINEPTFGKSNDTAKTDTNIHFSHERGVYPSNFSLSLNTDPNLTIRYTTDGTDPSSVNGKTYESPILINKTSVVKAMAYGDSVQTGITAHSYILENNLQNEVRNGKVWQYKESITSEEYAKGIKDFPIISVTSNLPDLNRKNHANGTFEYIDAHTGISHGNYFSLASSKKYGQVSSKQYNSGVAIKFNRAAGTKKAKYEFFEPTSGDSFKPVKKFSKLQLKEGQDGPQNDIYGLGYNRYDEKVTNTLAKQMGKLGLNSRYVHYFYNGRYFGVKTLRENFGEKMFEEYFGGNDDEYTKIRFQDAGFANGRVEDKSSNVWPEIKQTVTNNDFQEAKKYIDFDDLINTHILYMFVDTEREVDAVVQNSVLENDPNAVKMRFNVNDTDGAFHNRNKTGTAQASLAGGGGTYRFKWNSDAKSKRGAGKIFGTFSGNSTNDKLGNLEFKTMVKDRVALQYGTFNENKNTAPLTVNNVQSLIKENIVELDNAYKLDAAFMGARKNMYQDWKNYQDNVLNQVPDRVNFTHSMWKKYHLAHTLDPVHLVEENGNVLLFNASTEAIIYYTTDGSDPMGNDGTISKSAIKYSKDNLPKDTDTLTIRPFEPNNWGPLVTK